MILFRLVLTTVVVAGLIIGFFPTASLAATDSNKYVRTANYYLLSGTALETSEARRVLPKFDLLVLPAEAQLYNQSFFSYARSVNPDIIILAYVPSVSYNDIWSDSLHQNLLSGISSSYWLKDGSGNQKSVWPGTRAMNLNSDWNYYLAEFVHNNIMSTGLWDGIFYDEVSDEISWIGSVDTDNNGVADNAGTANSNWRSGYVSLLARSRQLEGSNKIIITNGSSNSSFQSYVNGRMFESFPTPWEGNGTWQTVVNNYLNLENQVGDQPPIFIINTNTDNTGNQADYDKMRYGITSTLLGGGYFSFDFGDQSHAQLWEYDEYGAYLGAPMDEPEDMLNPANSSINESVWARDFEQGKVLVNATDQTQSVRLGGEYEKLHGTQDPSTNNGAIVSTVTLPPHDGIILLRPIDNIQDATFMNGAFARFFDSVGNTERTGFFAYNGDYQGGDRVIEIDIDHDGLRETVVADERQVRIYESDGSLHASFYPYTVNYDKGINFTVADLEDDGTMEIITGTENGGGPQVRIFNKDGVLINPGFFAYAENFRGGVDVAVGDLDGDGLKEIICGAGYGGGPHIRIFSKHGNLVNPGFFAYSENFRGGVNVATGDLNHDGIEEIISGAGKTGGPHVRVYNNDGDLLAQFFAFDSTSRNGVEVTAADIDGDGRDEIIALSTEVFTFSFSGM